MVKEALKEGIPNIVDEKVKKWWLIKAHEDLKVAEHEMSLSENEIIASDVCFHSQQFVKRFKGLPDFCCY